MFKYKKSTFYKNQCGVFNCNNPKLLFAFRKKISIISSKFRFQLHPKYFESVLGKKSNKSMVPEL